MRCGSGLCQFCVEHMSLQRDVLKFHCFLRGIAKRSGEDRHIREVVVDLEGERFVQASRGTGSMDLNMFSGTAEFPGDWQNRGMGNLKDEIAQRAFTSGDEDLRCRCGVRLIQSEVFAGTVERCAQSSGRI